MDERYWRLLKITSKWTDITENYFEMSEHYWKWLENDLKIAITINNKKIVSLKCHGEAHHSAASCFLVFIYWETFETFEERVVKSGQEWHPRVVVGDCSLIYFPVECLSGCINIIQRRSNSQLKGLSCNAVLEWSMRANRSKLWCADRWRIIAIFVSFLFLFLFFLFLSFYIKNIYHWTKYEEAKINHSPFLVASSEATDPGKECTSTALFCRRVDRRQKEEGSD